MPHHRRNLRQALRQEIGAPSSAAAPGECPRCSHPMNCAVRRPHDTFGAFGIEIHLIVCNDCHRHVELRTFRPGKGYLRLAAAESLWRELDPEQPPPATGVQSTD